MKTLVFGTKPYDRRFLEAANDQHGHSLTFLEPRLDEATAALAAGYEAVCVFVNDTVSRPVLDILAEGGVRVVALRCAGYNNVDLAAAEELGIAVVRVPAYSPNAVSEFTVGLVLALDRKIHRAWARVRENNFALDGLIGRNLESRTVGVIGTGRIGALVARAFKLGFGCEVLASDPYPDAELAAVGIRYVEPEMVLRSSDIVSLHCPLTPKTRHLVDAKAIAEARDGLLLVNTSRGALIDTRAVIDGLKSGKIGGVALDVYEQEADLFFEDLSSEIIQDDDFQRLLTFPNVLVTGHQAFLTEEALRAIAETTLTSLSDYEAGRPLANRVEAEKVRPSHLASEAS
ncbi:2-hydroxyacid dehydrogenase [Tianweitania sp. BSSL-BM11]|uniref:2-hydroxyacid dehydrogenase n=1 Tax=Tianweitania aestuarii TaxID=2814886 RepID=A0ABS5RYU9_9HYPH|nr:2-hydroxyacid dehydrogenase [Tianweitania aestuarii]MBS9722201.1 2-hydroxyacid dehydrogenase [Tianweitania aestuarii]